MHLLVALPHLIVPGRAWCRAHFTCPSCGADVGHRYRKRTVRKVVHLFEARVPVYWFECRGCGRLAYVSPVGLPRGSRYTDAVRLMIEIRYVLGFTVARTQASMAAWSVSPSWVKQYVAQLRAADPTAEELHDRNRHRQATFQIAGSLGRQYAVPGAGVTDIETGYLLLSVRGDGVGRATLGWIVARIALRLRPTGAGARLLRRKPSLSPHRELTLKDLETDADSLRFILDQLQQTPLQALDDG